ncbi:MAG: Fe-S-containing hydro-lyase [Clostridiales bacterium]|nr:Fe-S-containing hydro-lyase [Clostridiales bacterium]
MAVKKVALPLTDSAARALRAGDAVLLTGSLYTARDAAHKRLVALLQAGKPLPIDLAGETIYYVGPAPAGPGRAVGPAGPTTSSRMDAYAPKLIELGLRGMIGKGLRSAEVAEAMKRHGAVYFGAVGGAAALISRAIESSRVVAYEDLGAEAIHRFEVRDFPALVLIDSVGGNLYQSGPEAYRRLMSQNKK